MIKWIKQLLCRHQWHNFTTAGLDADLKIYCAKFKLCPKCGSMQLKKFEYPNIFQEPEDKIKSKNGNVIEVDFKKEK